MKPEEEHKVFAAIAVVQRAGHGEVVIKISDGRIVMVEQTIKTKT